MNKQLAEDVGFLGINVDQCVDIAWLKTEVANKIKEGDQSSIYKLLNFSRHSEDEKIRDYSSKIETLYNDMINNYGNPNVSEDGSEEEVVTPDPDPTPNNQSNSGNDGGVVDSQGNTANP